LGDEPRDDEKVTHSAGVTEITNRLKVVIGKAEGKRKIGRPRGRWENNIEINLKYRPGGGGVG